MTAIPTDQLTNQLSNKRICWGFIGKYNTSNHFPAPFSRLSVEQPRTLWPASPATTATQSCPPSWPSSAPRSPLSPSWMPSTRMTGARLTSRSWSTTTATSGWSWCWRWRCRFLPRTQPASWIFVRAPSCAKPFVYSKFVYIIVTSPCPISSLTPSNPSQVHTAPYTSTSSDLLNL